MYRSRVKAQMERNPSLVGLYDFLSQPGARPRCSRIVSLDFAAHDKSPTCRLIQPTDLALEVHKPRPSPHPGAPIQSGQILIVEDISPEEIEILGGALELDPCFFASYISRTWRNLKAQDPQACTLPSRERRQGFVPLYYHRTIVAHGLEPHTAQLLRTCNHPRKLFVLSPVKGQRLGLAQHACVVSSMVRADGRWIGIILADPPFRSRNDYVALRSRSPVPTNLSITPFLGGCEDFQYNAAVHASSFTQPLNPDIDTDGIDYPRTKSDRRGMLDELVYYWTASGPPAGIFEASGPPSLHALAYLPLRIVAAEWVNYITLVDFSAKEYEWNGSDNDAPGRGTRDATAVASRTDWKAKVDALDARLRALQAWRRRVMSSMRKMRQVARFLDSPVPGVDGACCNGTSDRHFDHGAANAWAALRSDYMSLATEITEHGARLESMLAVVASGMALLEGRRALAEAANITRLTVLAFVFLPLTFVAGLFSIGGSDVYAPGGSHFWVYWAVALPLTLIVMLMVRPPVLVIMMLKGLEEWVSGLR
ncbi:uncharacterized protein TrAFT101_008054 [Trichoderma asperellum]|uniref:uncharacterized protein n=1 Tax=Trichoderma asperellum TaxID=101201 RepID=UPI0033347CCD|nr:hypothetical protein TrAFT101_008054 [Trichoderma asperellum]